VEADEIDVVSFAVFGDFEEIEDSEEPRCTRELGSDVGEADWLDGVDLDLALVHGISTSYADAWTHPNADGRGDLSAAYPIAKALGENHTEIFS
jgi:hypothetical protein